MNCQKIQLTFTPQEVAVLSVKASVLGYDVTKYAKFVLSRIAFEEVENIPTFKMSKKMEKISDKAVEEYRQGKLKSYSSTGEMFADL